MASSVASSIVKAEGLSKRVIGPAGSLDILSDVTFTINRGESVAIVGASGAGKSTLLGLLAGLDTATSGSVHLNGVDLFTLDEDGRARVRGEMIGFVFQSFQLLPSLTALENVMLPLELADRDDAATVARGVLDRVGLKTRLDHYPKQLSGGEQQRVAIARAFAPDPALLCADEPTGNLDRATGQHVMDLLFDLNRELGTTLLLVTHDEQLAARCQRRFELVDGRLASQ